MTSQLLWVLIGIQIAMGAFDTLYHHEMTERLAWRTSQHRELQLHGVRNLFYALLFIALGWTEVHGYWAIAVVAVLAAEVIITLMDFVEEDLSRKLPASERVNHTLLALNYGAILVLIAPVLFEWAGRPTTIVPAYYGLWSWLALLAAIGVTLFGIRDLFASRRVLRLIEADAAELVSALPSRRRVLVTGATGFIGARLTEALARAGHEVIALVRDPGKAASLTPPLRFVTDLEQIAADEKIDAIVNLAGEPIANGLWTARKRREILRSRLRTTYDLVRLISRLETAPEVLVSGSAIGWYGLRNDEALTEDDSGKACFSNRLCAAWERAAMRAEKYGVRVVRLRIGLVLGVDGGMLSRLLTPFEFGLGGPLGDGRQWMSWIGRDDLVRVIAHVIATPAIDGPVNATAPNPVRNNEFVRELGRAMRRPAILRAPAWILRLAAGDFAEELLLGGQRVIPNKLRQSGFEFRHGTLGELLPGLLGAPRRTGSAHALPAVQAR